MIKSSLTAGAVPASRMVRTSGSIHWIAGALVMVVMVGLLPAGRMEVPTEVDPAAEDTDKGV